MLFSFIISPSHVWEFWTVILERWLQGEKSARSQSHALFFFQLWEWWEWVDMFPRQIKMIHTNKNQAENGGAKSAELCPVWEKHIVEHFAAFRTLWILERFFPSAHVVLAFVARLLRPLLLAWVGSGIERWKNPWLLMVSWELYYRIA